MIPSKALIPGKIMLAGEYAVLRGERALAATIQAWLSVEITSENLEGGVLCSSSLWNAPVLLPRVDANQPSTPDHEPLVDTARYLMRERHLSNARIHVHSPLKTTWGAGTSSALRLGVLLAAQHATSATTDSLTLAREAWALQRRQQREASGYDVATQITGGAIVFTPPSGRGLWPGAIASLPVEDLQRLSEHVHVVVGGRGAPTTATLGSTLEWIDQTAQAATIQSTQRELVDGFLGFARGLLSLETLCQSCERARRVFESSPRFPSEIKDALRQDSRSDSEWSWKTSGAGGEDALILIGKRDSLRAPLQTLARLGWMPLGIPFGGVPSVSTFTPSEDRS